MASNSDENRDYCCKDKERKENPHQVFGKVML